MSWNYRVIKDASGAHSIHEVYYDEHGNPRMAAESPSAPWGETPEELAHDLAAMTLALHKPVLDIALFMKEPEAAT